MKQEELELLLERNMGITNALLGYLQKEGILKENKFLDYCDATDYGLIQKEMRRNEAAAQSQGHDLHAGGTIATIDLCNMAGITSDDYVLDAGTGHGGAARVMAKKFGCRVMGIDMDYPRLVHAMFRTKAEGLDSLVGFCSTDAYHMLFEENTFDAIVRQHAVYGQEEMLFLQECYRVLKPGGRIAFQGVLAGALMRSDRTSMDHFTLKEYIESLEKAGFGRINIETEESTMQLMESYQETDKARYALAKKKLLIGIKLIAYKEESHEV